MAGEQKNVVFKKTSETEGHFNSLSKLIEAPAWAIQTSEVFCPKCFQTPAILDHHYHCIKSKTGGQKKLINRFALGVIYSPRRKRRTQLQQYRFSYLLHSNLLKQLPFLLSIEKSHADVHTNPLSWL